MMCEFHITRLPSTLIITVLIEHRKTAARIQ